MEEEHCDDVSPSGKFLYRIALKCECARQVATDQEGLRLLLRLYVYPFLERDSTMNLAYQ